MKPIKLITAASMVALMGSLAVANAADLTTLNFDLDGTIEASPDEIDSITLEATAQLLEENRQVSESALSVTTDAADITQSGAPDNPEINDNLIFAEGIGNEFESTTLETTGSDISNLDTSGDALVASGQLFAPSDISSVSTDGDVDVQIDYTSTPVTTEDNRITAMAMGNTTDVGMSGDIPSGFSSSDVGSFDLNVTAPDSALVGTATLQLANQQATEGLANGSDPIASTSDSLVQLILSESTAVADTINVNSNQIDASFTGNDADLSTTLGDAERSVFDGTLSAASVQSNTGAAGIVNVTNSDLSVDFDNAGTGAGIIDGGSVNVTGNSILATSQGNLSAIKLEGDENIALVGGGTTPSRVLDGDAATTIAIDSDVIGVSSQTNLDSEFTSSATDISQTVELKEVKGGGSLDISSNRLAAQADANNTITSMSFAGGSFDNSLSAASTQSNTGDTTVSASLGDGNTPRIRADFGDQITVIDGALSLDSNLVVTQARGNVADTSVTLTPDGSVSGPLATATSSTATFTPADDSIAVTDSDAALLTAQENADGDQSFSATINGGDVSLRGVGDTDSTITGSVSLDNNAILAEARGNLASSELTINAGNVTSRNVVGTSQSTGVGGSATVEAQSTLNLTTIADLTAAATDATISLESNLIGTQAVANQSTNTQAITADTSLLTIGQTGDEATATDAGVFTASGSFAATNLQRASDTVVTADSSSLDRVSTNTTGGSLTNSSLSLSNNTLIAEARANRTTNSVGLVAGTSIGDGDTANLTSAVIQNAQSLLEDTGTTSVTASTDNTRVQIFGAATVTDSTVGLDNNLLAAVAEGNGATNSVTANAGTNIDSTADTGSATSINAAGDVSASANFAISNNQAVVGDIDASGSDLGVDVTLGELSGDTRVSASDNALLGQARGNTATNQVVIDAEGGVDTTAGIASQQVVADDTLTGSITDANVSLTTTDIATASLAVDDNVIGGLTTGSTVTNRIDLAAGTSLSGEATTGTTAAVGTSTDVDASGNFTIASLQNVGTDSTDAATITATASDSEVDIEFGALTGNGNVSVSDNAILAEARGTQGTNLVGVGNNGDLNAGTEITSTAGIVSDQTTFGALTSTAGATASTNTLSVTGTGALANGSVKVNDNAVTAVSTANSSQNVIDMDAGTSFAVADGQATADVTGTTEAPVVDTTGASFAIADRQLANGAIDASSTGTTTEISLDSVGSEGSLEVNNNATLAEARGNVANNRVALDATNTLDASAGITSAQAQTGAITASVNDTTTRLNVDGAIASGTAVVDGNSIGSLAAANTGSNTLLANAGTIELSSGDVASSNSGTLSTTADVAITSQQDVTRTSEASTATTTDALVQLTADSLTNAGSLAATNNTISAGAELNRQTNTLQLLAGDDSSAGTSITSSGAITNLQNGALSTSDLTSTVDSTTDDMGILVDSGTVNDEASLLANDNAIVADTSGNVVSNRLNAQATTELGSTGLAAADVFNTPDTVGGDFVIQNKQGLTLGDSTLSATVGGTADGNPVISVTSALANGSVALNNNAITASVDGNDASNVLTLGAGTTLGVSSAVANRQDVSGGTLTATVNTPRIELNKTGATSDGRLAINGNRIEATASANNALNAVAVSAGTSATGSGTDATGNNATLTADYAVLNSQNSGAAVTAAINGGAGVDNISLDNADTFAGLSTLENNRIVASAFGNQAINQASLTNVAGNAASIGISNSQYSGGAITATVNGASVNASINDGGASRINGNSIGSRAVGNSASSRVINR